MMGPAQLSVQMPNFSLSGDLRFIWTHRWSRVAGSSHSYRNGPGSNGFTYSSWKFSIDMLVYPRYHWMVQGNGAKDISNNQNMKLIPEFSMYNMTTPTWMVASARMQQSQSTWVLQSASTTKIKCCKDLETHSGLLPDIWWPNKF